MPSYIPYSTRYDPRPKPRNVARLANGQGLVPEDVVGRQDQALSE